MPKYIVNDKVYNIPDDKVKGFESKYPDARVVYYNEGKTYKLPLGKRDGFLKQYPSASLEMPANDNAATASQPTRQAAVAVPSSTAVPSPSVDDVKVEPVTAAMPTSEGDDNLKMAVTDDGVVKTGNDAMQRMNREQVSSLKPLVEEALSKRGRTLDDEQKQREADMPFLARLGNNMPRGGGMAGMPVYAKTNNGRLTDNEYVSLSAASRSLTNAERIIAEADHNAQRGSFGDWWERSFAGGAARALGQKAFDPTNWDMGLSDGLEAGAMKAALDAFDNGEELTEAQQMLLDAKAIELATNAYFGSEVGRGYKAGSVTAESLPFMMEMLINPAAGIGKGASAQMTRYALKRFGKEALKGNAKKYAAAKAVTRVAGDIVGAGTMAATTGSGRVAAGAIGRMNGDVQFASDEEGYSVFAGHTEGEDFGAAIGKEFAATAIENYSEMVGNYFAPVLGAGGKAVRRGLDKIGLGKVNKFMDDVRMSDIGKLVDDFESHAQWNGVIGEYAEEVAGGIMNAIVVGDQTLDTDEDTGVFNLERNIDTFLGVALLGGFMSSVKTLGYRTPQYRAKQQIQEKDKEGASAFADNPAQWNAIRDYFNPERSTAITDEDRHNTLAALLDENGMYMLSDEQKRAVLSYVQSVEAYRGMVKGKERQRGENTFNANMEADVADAYEEGRALIDEESDEELIDARNGYMMAKENLARSMGCDVEELKDALLGGGVYGSLEERLRTFSPENWGEEHTGLFVDYMNARARYNGMIERVQDDIDGKVATALQHIDENRGADGNITPAVLVDEELDVYVVNRSGENVVVRDGNGQLRMVSSDQVRLTGEPISAETAKAEAEERIREEESAAAAARIDGTVQLVPGNVYPILIGDEVTGEDTRQTSTITIMQDNGDGTAVVMLGGDERQQQTLPVDAIQGMVDTYHRGRLEAMAEQAAIDAAARLQASQVDATASQPTKQTASDDALVGGTVPTTEQQTMANGQQTVSNTQGSVQEAAPATALERIPVNEQGEQDFEKAPVADSWAALLELNEGDAVEAKDTAEQMVQEAQKALEKEQKKKAAGGSTIMEIQKAKAAHKAMLRGLQSRVEYWTRVVNYEEDMRKAEAEAKRRQRKMEQAERGRQLASAGRYTEEYRALGPSQSFREYVLRAISSGGVKFIWSNNDNGTKGLGAHLGLNTPSERGKRLWLQSNSEGMYPELAAQSLLEGYAAEQGMMGYVDEETGMTTMDALNDVLDVLGSYDSPSAMFEEVQRMRSEQEEYDADEYAEQEALYQLEQEAEANRMSVNEWMTYNEMLAEHINDVFGTVTDEEILSIFANEYEERDYERSRIDDALEQGVPEGQGSVEGDGGGRRMVQADGRVDGGDIAGRGEPSSHGVDDGGQQGIGELSSPSVSGEHREIAGLDGYTESDVKDLVREHVEDIISVEGFEDVRIVGIKVIGSRVNGNATEESDLDVLVEYEGNAREDSLFNLFNGGDVHAQLYIEGIQVDINPITRGKSGTIEQWMERNAGYSKPSLGEQIKDAETEVNINPTDKQKEAGNYKKGHVQIGTFNVTIEQPKGSVRSGVDANGKQWEITMQNTYGYIRGTEGVDGDHIDVFLSDDIDGWDGHKVFVVDQCNADGSFDEHKVMLGFNDINDAEAAYMSNYEEGWQGLGAITGVSIEEFEKWIASSHRKTKAFAEYKSVKTTEGQSASAERRNLAEAQTTAATASQRRGQKSLFDVAAEIAEKSESEKWRYSVSVDKETGATTLRREDVSGVIPIGDARFSVTASSPQEMLDILRNPQNGMQEALDAVGVTLENKIRTRRMDVAVNDQPKKVDVGGVFADLSGKGEAKLSDHVEQPANASGNRLVTDERYAELRERMRNKLNGRMNMGVDPEILAIGTEMAVYHIEKGARRFAEFAKAMIADLGDAIRPYLKSFYNGARELPEMESAGLTDAMTPYDEVRTFDVANFDKASTDMAAAAEEVIKEQAVAEQEQTAKEAIKKERKKRGNSKESLPLLGDLFNTNTENHERRDQETHQGLGREERQEGEGAERRGTAGGRSGNNVSDQEGGRGVSELSGQHVKAQRNGRNFSFGEDGIQLPSGEVGKLKANIAAIRTLKELEESGKEATAEQKQVLSRYVGWGGLSEALNSDKYDKRNGWQADRGWNEKYLPYYEQLKSLLTEEEFNSAVQSTNTSHFTPDTVIRGLWDIVERLGFKHGRISEPAMGIGHILGFMPRGISAASVISGFEIDSLSGRISTLLYPDADVKVQGYETAFAPKSKDLVITNVPFGKTAPYDKALDKVLRPKMKGAYNLHNYFIAKGLLELKEGALGVFVTSSATMDGADSRFREFVVSNGFDLLGAIRLPNTTFQKNAGTSVTADVLVFRRRKQGESSNGMNFTSLTQIGEGSYQENGETRMKPLLVNEYFAEHPEMILGEMMTAHDAGSGGLYSGASQTCKPHAGADLQTDLREAVSRFAIGAIGENSEESQDTIASNEEAQVTDAKNGTLVVQGDDVYIAIDGQLQPIESIARRKEFVYNGKKRKVSAAVKHYNELKSRLAALIQAEQSADVDPEPIRADVNRLYDSFVSQYGTLNRNKALSDVLSEDFEHSLPFSLEEVRRVPSASGKSMVWEVSKGHGILEKRVSYPISEPTEAENIQDAANISLSYRGYLDIPYMASLLSEEETLIEERILDEGIAYRDPSTGNLMDRETYLSGNVKEKLEQARAMAEEHPEYKRNVDDLVEAQPETVRFGDISYRLGTPWIPTEHIDSFAEEVLGISRSRVNHVESLNEYIVSNYAYVSDHSKGGMYRTERMSAVDLFAAALNQRKPKIFDTHKRYDSVRGKYVEERVPNEAETQAAAEKIMEISDKFIEYIDGKKEIHRELERIYNDKYNNYRLKNYSAPVFEHYPGANPAITLRAHQTKGVQRGLQGSTLLAHQVGTGKTFTMITTAMEMRRLGIARKPMIVVQNATLEDFVRDFYKLYPGARVLAPGKDERSAENRKRLFNLIATGDFDAIVIPQSFLSFIPDDEGRKAALIQQRIDEYEDALERIEDNAIRRRMEREIDALRDSMEGGEKKKSRSVKDKAKAAERVKAKMSRQLDRRTDEVMTFEQMGIDALFIDEAHNYKKIGFASKMSNVKGVDTGASQRANSLLLKVRWVQEKNGGRNVVLATGTPITNTMAEVWTMMNFVAPDILEDYDITSFDDFATTFGTVEPSLEFTATGNFKIADRFKSYVNVPELVKAFRSHTDVVLTEDVKEFKESNNIPKLHNGQMTNEVIGKNEDLEDVMQILIKRLEEYNEMSGQEKKKWSALPLVVFTKAKQAAIDLRLLNPTYADNPESKTNRVVANVLKLYKESNDYKGAQLIFCDSYQSPGEQPQMDLFDYDASVPRFNLYEDIKAKLVAGGVPASEIAIINNYDGERRKALFEKVRNGEVRILLGSTEKMGVGVNVQDRLYAAHHIDAPIRPMDFEQRNGRILRQGNLHATWGKPVHVVTYGVEGTLDATAYDRLRIKQAFINQMMKGDVAGRVMEEQDDEDPSGMTFNQMAATLSGDKTAQLLFVAENKLKKLRNLKRSDTNSKSSMRENIHYLQMKLGSQEERRGVYERANAILSRSFPDGITEAVVDGKAITEKFSSALDEILESYDEQYSMNRGIAPLNIYLNGGAARVIVHYNEGRMVYELYAGDEHVVESRQISGGRGLVSSLEHQIKATSKNLADAESTIAQLKQSIAGLESAAVAPWGREEELRAAEEEVAGLRKQLEEKAAENTKSKGKDVSLSEIEDGSEDGRKEAVSKGGPRGRRSEKQGENQDNIRQAQGVRGVVRKRIDEFEQRTGWTNGLSDKERIILEDVRELTDSEIATLRSKAVESIERGADVDEAQIVLSLLDKYGRSGERLYILSQSGIIPNQPVSLDQVEQLFSEYNTDEGLAMLFDRLRPIIEKINPKITFEVIRDADRNVKDDTVGDYWLKGNHIRLNLHSLNSSYQTDQEKASTIVHEILHAVAQYALDAKLRVNDGKDAGIEISNQLLDAAQSLINIYNAIKDNPILAEEYGIKDVHEMVSELANPEFRDKLKQIEVRGKNVWERIKDAIKRLLGIDLSAYRKVSDALDVLLDNFDIDAYERARSLGGTDVKQRKFETSSQLRIQFEEERIDQEYLDAVHNGNWEKATDLFREYVLSKAENEGIVPMDYGVGYRGGAHSSIAKRIKEGNPDAITEAAYQMSIRIPRGSILVPMPSHNGDATYTVKLAETIAMATDSEVMDVLKGKARMSVYEAKQKGIQLRSDELGMYVTEELPKGRNVVIIDNVIDKGTTALAAVSAVKGASVVAYAYTLGDKSRVAPLKLAEPVTYDDNMRIIPLSERYNREREDIRYRGGEGAVSDHDVSFQNDPISKFLGKSRHSKKQQATFAERERRRMKQAVKEVAKKLGVTVDIVEDAALLHGRKARAKGWFDVNNGKIVVVIPNHVSAWDAVQTVLHEGIAHHGLRKMFGKHFDTFIENVYANADAEVREKIHDLARLNGLDLAKATEEYLASLAEDTNFERAQHTGWWDKIKQFFVEMLTKAGVKLDIKLTDNELRYILWRSYKNLVEPGSVRTFAGVAEDVVMQSRLSVGNHTAATPSQHRVQTRAERERERIHRTGRVDTSFMIPRVADSDEHLMFRSGGTPMSARERYNRAVRVPNKSGSVKGGENMGYRLREAYQDSMLALRKLQDIIAEDSGVEIQSGENAYMAENRMSSENKAQAEIYERDFFNPLRDAVVAIVKRGETYEMVNAYLIAKHGLERNLLMSEREAKEKGEVWDGSVTRDYSGLSELTGDKADFTRLAQELVDEFESKHDTTQLWDRINAATKETLRKSYDSGLMDKETYEKVRDMFEYYIPLRGWSENVAANEFEYLMKDGHLQLSSALKSMHGRRSVADDPIATIGFMAESAIVQGNRNLMKQKFLNFVLNRPTDLATVNEQWYVLDNATKEWEPRNPEIPKEATADEVDAIVKKFEADMETEAKVGNAKKVRKGLKLKEHATVYEGQEHVVKVRRGGKEYCIYINGSPRAAQALNGLTNPNANSSWLYQRAMDIKNFMARMFTSQNPAFIATNLSRDVMWAGTAVAVKEDKKYVAKYTKNIASAFVKARLPRLLYNYQHGTLNLSDPIERYFDEFIRHGGETGFTQVNTVEDYKRNIRRFVKEAQRHRAASLPKKAWRGLWEGIEFLNRSAEDTTRFMVYMTSRQMGRDISRSVWDAKEITVNFNKKGSGGLGASVMNFAYIFFNATIQGLSNFGKLFGQHKGKMSVALSTFALSGLIVPMLNEMVRGLFGDDDDDEERKDGGYWDLPEWVRRNNLVLYLPWTENGYITFPISHELRPFFGMGELAYSVLMGKEEADVALEKAIHGFSALLPLDYTGNGGNLAINFTPTIGQPIAQIIANKDYFGKPIYRRNDWNELYPEWTKAYKGTSAMLVDGTKWLNEVSGGDDVVSGDIDLNPAIIEHLFESYLGGVGKTINRSAKTFSMLWNEEMREWRNVPVVSSFYQTGSERTAGSQLNREYYDAIGEHKESQHILSGYRSQALDGAAGYAEKLDEFMKSPTYQRYALIHEYKSVIDMLSKELKSAGATNRDELEDTIRQLKIEMLDELEAMEK
ncbi:MAG: nucleotidyltransferase domain-containing protein [Bacteroidaceae bacterium]|nr:nucleotidyltransferase domain-containing protein [Bacteroidaceae bacterium]